MDFCSIAGIPFQCYQLDSAAQKFFGFSEFISGLALLILAWTTTDVRYKFRISTATIPVEKISFFIIIIVGVLALITDLWRAKNGWVPLGTLITPEEWQFLLGALFFLTLLIWLWFAFIFPSKFNRFNSKKFLEVIKTAVMKGSPNELGIIANELTRSVARVVSYAPEDIDTLNDANFLLMTIGSNKFCKATVQDSPELIYNLFDEIRKQRKYQIYSIEIFTKNIITAALENKNSFLYHEIDYYESALEGMTKPITSKLYQDIEIINNIPTLLSPSYSKKSPWDIDQWKAYTRLFLDAYSCYINSNYSSRPPSIHWALLIIKSIVDDLKDDLQLTSLDNNHDLSIRINILIDVIKSMVNILNQAPLNSKLTKSASEDVVRLIFLLIEKASSVRSPRHVAKRIHHTFIWEELINSHVLNEGIGLTIRKNIYDKLFNTVLKCPNLNSVRIFAYCLNVLGFYVHTEGEYGESWREFHMKFLEWVKHNAAELLDKYPSMKFECFVEGISYDSKNCRLVIEYPAKRARSTSYEYFQLSSKKNDINLIVIEGMISESFH